MPDPVYVITLGSGLYLDEHGELHSGPIPPVPSYTLPGGVLATANELGKVSKTFKDIGDALPNEKDDPKKFEEFAKKFSDLGLPNDDFAKLLGVVGKIAGTIGTVFVVVGAVVAAAKLLGLFDEGPSPLEQLVKARFDALDREIRALHALAVQKDLARQRDALAAARSTVQSFVAQRDSGTMTTAEIESRLQTLSTALSLLSVNQIIGLLDPITYTVLFDQGQYLKVWPALQTHLVRVPADTPPQNAAFPEVNAPFFDHRLAVVLAPQAAQTFLALVRSLSPEFRTTGDFRPTLRDLADKLTELAATIRNTALARTIYPQDYFSSRIIEDFYVDDPLPGIIAPTLKPDYSLVVGAMDLVSHDDAFFRDVTVIPSGPPPGPSRRGSLDFRWQPPARLERSQFDRGFRHRDGTPVIEYVIVNPKECADAANDLSLQGYADLLLSSGYLTLAQLAAQMHHAATQPDKSETVHGDVLLQRRPQARAEVTVVSAPGPILFTRTGEIKATAVREPQEIRAFAACSTQPIPRTPPLIHYRVLLRTLSSAIPPRGWSDPDYSTAVQSASYIADPLHPGFQRLALSTSFGAVLQEELLAEGSTQTGARHVERTLSFKAHTFDWWIPVQPNRVVGHDSVHAVVTERHAIGNAAARTSDPLPKLTLPGAAATVSESAASVILGLGWEDGAQSWQGQHRDTAEATVQMRVRLDWQVNKLRVAIENRPEDRNYIVFLVVEETFGSVESDEVSPKVLHTAFPIPINGQLTYVPQALLDQEAEATRKQRAFAEKFAKSVNPKPGGPVFGTIGVRELATDAGVARLAAALRQFAPEVLANLTRGERA